MLPPTCITELAQLTGGLQPAPTHVAQAYRSALGPTNVTPASLVGPGGLCASFGEGCNARDLNDSTVVGYSECFFLSVIRRKLAEWAEWVSLP